MVLQDCSRCGRTFASIDGETLCKKCLAEDLEDDFKIVRDYLYDNPGASINEVAENTKVDRKIIIKLLREDRIEITEVEQSIITCVKCGKKIKSGTMCDECKKNELMKDLNSAAKELKKDLEPKEDEKNKKKKIIFHTR